MAANQGSNGVVHELGPVARWYDNRSVFITGASGFMGKVLVEKLLSACPGISQVFILMRGKKDVSPDKRLEQLKQIPLFDNLRRTWPQRLDKLVAVTGNLLSPELGISPDDQRALAASVSVVFHSAATVKFDEALRLSVDMNIMGTRRLIALAKRMPKLEALVHVSTAYCNCDHAVVEEKVYPPPGDIHKLLQCMECMDDEMIDMMTTRIIGNRPNTYTYTKSMAEHILVNEAAGMPFCIFRPSIVTASVRSPMPGWVDNLNGPTGVITGAGKGFLRTLLCRRDMRADIIPVDVCINTMVVAAWDTARECRQNGYKVFNVTTGSTNPILWGELEKWAIKQLLVHPFDGVLWYPGGTFKSNRLYNELCVLLFHMIPAYILDFSAKMFASKPAPSMVRIHHKLQKAVGALEYFTTNEWTFKNNNVRAMCSKLTEADRKTFDFDVTKIQWRPYIENYVLGIRRYILKEQEKDIPQAKQRLQKMHALDIFTKLVLFFVLWRWVIGSSPAAKKFSYTVISQILRGLQKLTSF